MKMNRLTQIDLEKEYDKVEKDYETLSSLIEQLYKEGSMVDPKTHAFLRRQPKLEGMRYRTVPFLTDEFGDPLEGGLNFSPEMDEYEERELADGGATSSPFLTFLDNFSKQQQFQSDRRLAELEATREYLKTPEGRDAMITAGVGLLSLLPVPGMKRILGSRLSRFPFNRDIPVPAEPVIKQQTFTELGLEPKQLELALKGGRGKEPLTSKYRVNQKPLTNLDYYPNKLDRIINRRPANPLERTEIEELTKRGFYGPTPKSSPPIKRDPPGYGQSDEAIPPLEIEKRVRQAQQLQKLDDERSFLNTQASRINSMRQQGEATQKDMNQLEEIRRRIAELDELLK